LKAVIMAGGEGTRLRPLSLGMPKPMTPLFDRPVMEHMIGLLKTHGITDICVTLQYMPQTVMDYFGDGAEQGVKLTYFVEEEPLGTAGSVKNCAGYLGEEDFLVISGDAVCDLDLSAAIGFHKTRRSAATLVLYRHPSPLEYGLVLTDEEGRIQRFIEKPGWGQVLTNMVNTGIYVLTGEAMALVPEGKSYDFGKDLFPLLLERGAAMYGTAADGYWCDMGDAPAYLQCVADALGGKVMLDLGAPKRAPGIWSASPIPAGIELVPPCYIGADTTIGDASLIGPNTAIGAGSTVGKGALVQQSVLHGAKVGDRATLYGAILCRGASAGAGAVLNEGSVLGEDAVAGRDAILMEGVKVWPNREAPAGGRLTASLTSGGLRGPMKFGDGGIIRGIIGDTLTPELLLLLGNVLGDQGQAGLGYSGGAGAEMLARAAGSGIAAAGCRVISHDAPTPSAGAWLAQRHELPAALFVEQEGDRAYLHLAGRGGLPLGRARERKIETALLRGEVRRMPAGRVGVWESIAGVEGTYAADAARIGRRGRAAPPITVSVPGKSPAESTLARALTQLGCTVIAERRDGISTFTALHGGFYLGAWDERGNYLESERMLTLAVLLELERGALRIAVPPAAPAAIDLLTQSFGGTALRLGRDGIEAEERYAALPTLRDATFGAALICAHMAATGERLYDLTRRAPQFAVRRRELPIRKTRGDLMQALYRAEPKAEQAGEGLRLKVGSGWVYIAPLTRRPALKVVGEGFDAELAEELCNFYVEKARKLDGSHTVG
jgi:mannose-1-phosphate guanylyltransferase/phosphomannomutase